MKRNKSTDTHCFLLHTHSTFRPRVKEKGGWKHDHATEKEETERKLDHGRMDGWIGRRHANEQPGPHDLELSFNGPRDRSKNSLHL